MLTHPEPVHSNDVAPGHVAAHLAPQRTAEHPLPAPVRIVRGGPTTAAPTAAPIGPVRPVDASDVYAVPARLHVVAWNDEERDLVGHDARSAYVVRFWLGLLGPSATWLLRVLAHGLDASPNGFSMDCQGTARMRRY